MSQEIFANFGEQISYNQWFDSQKSSFLHLLPYRFLNLLRQLKYIPPMNYNEFNGSFAIMLVISSHEHTKMMCLKEMYANCQFVQMVFLHFINIPKKTKNWKIVDTATTIEGVKHTV